MDTAQQAKDRKGESCGCAIVLHEAQIINQDFRFKDILSFIIVCY